MQRFFQPCFDAVQPLIDALRNRVVQNIEEIQRNQPVAVTGAVVHSLGWMYATTTDATELNPHYVQDANKTPVAVYGIHGTFDLNSSCMKLTSHLINQQLPDQIVSIHRVAFEERRVSIERYAAQLRDKILQNGHKDVILIGHSRGGLVAAYFAEYLASIDGIRVHNVFSICAPFLGSYLVDDRLAGYTHERIHSIEQMKPDSIFLRDLCRLVTRESDKYTFIAAQHDKIVAPDACNPPHTTAIVFDRHAHISIMTSRRLAKLISRKIKERMQLLAIADAIKAQAYATPSMGIRSE